MRESIDAHYWAKHPNDYEAMIKSCLECEWCEEDKERNIKECPLCESDMLDWWYE